MPTINTFVATPITFCVGCASSYDAAELRAFPEVTDPPAKEGYRTFRCPCGRIVAAVASLCDEPIFELTEEYERKFPHTTRKAAVTLHSQPLSEMPTDQLKEFLDKRGATEPRPPWLSIVLIVCAAVAAVAATIAQVLR